MKKIIGTMAAAVALSFGASAHAVDVVVDTFTTPQAFLTDATGTALFTQVSSPGGDIIHGLLAALGYRDIGVETKMSPDFANVNASIGVSAGALRFSTDAEAGGTGMIRWDGVHAATSFTDVDTTGLGGIPLGDPFQSFFKLDINFADAGFDFVLQAWTDATHWSSINITSLAHPVPGTSYIPFLAFLDCDNMMAGPATTCASDGMGGWNPVDFLNLGALQAIIDPNGTYKSLDLTIDAVTVVPEPGSLALAGLGLMGVAFSGIRRRRNAG